MRPLPVIVFAGFSTLLIGCWWFVQTRERSLLQSRLDDTARLVSGRLESDLSSQFDRIELLARGFALTGPPTEPDFRAASRAHQSRYPGFQALSWVTPEGTIRWVEPELGNSAAVGLELENHPDAGPAFRTAARTGRISVTRPLELVQSGYGFATYTRVERHGETFGFLNGVFRIPALLENALPRPEDRELAYVLRSGDELLGALGPLPADREEIPRTDHPVRLRDHVWTLTVFGPARLAAARGTWIDEALLLLGLLLAAALAWTVRVAIERRHYAELSAERLRVVIENAPDAIVVMDAETGRFVDGNERAARLFELPRVRLPEISPLDRSPPRQADGRDSAEAFGELLAAAATDGSTWFEWLLVDGSGHELRTEMQLVRMPHEGRARVRASIVDVTERRELEEQLRRSQALEAMGQLAGGVAHDFNNLLTAILGASELLLERAGDDAESRELAQEAVDACERAADLTRQLLAFSRHAVVQPTRLDLNEVVRRMTPLLRRLLSAKVRLETRLAPAAVPVRADASQLELVVVNLVVNARDAMPEGGHITVSTRTLDERTVALSVEDEGLGIAPENIERIFLPFFTTKRAGLGTGIGLATVQRIVEQAGAEISVDSTPGSGTTFQVRFPRVGGELPPTDAAPKRELWTGTGTILLVEDDADVRSMIRRTLERAGYDVVDVPDAERALQLATADAGAFDLLLSDVVLPGMSGPDLVRRLTEFGHDIPTILVSGYSTSDTNEVVTGALEFLPKPFTPTELTRCVSRALGAKST